MSCSPLVPGCDQWRSIRKVAGITLKDSFGVMRGSRDKDKLLCSLLNLLAEVDTSVASYLSAIFISFEELQVRAGAPVKPE